MKKLICTILALASLASLSACGKAPESVQSDTPPAQVVPNDEQNTPPKTETPETEAPEAEPSVPESDTSVAELLAGLPTEYETLDVYLTDMLGQTPAISFRDERNCWTEDSLDDYGIMRWDNMDLRWDRAKLDLPEWDCRYTLRLENPETGWYAELYDGDYANYIYFSDLCVYVPVAHNSYGAPAAGIVDNAMVSIADWVFAEKESGFHYYGSAHSFLVKDAVNTRYVDDLGNGHEVILPEVQLDSADSETVNAAILEDYTSSIAGESTWYDKISYKWSVNGDVLSVVIQSGSGMQMSAQVYNFSVSSGALLSNDAVYAASGMQNLRTRVSHAIACYTGDELVDIALNMGSGYSFAFSGSPEENTFSVDLFTWGISDENFEAASPYINEYGQLCVIANIYQLAGAASHHGDVCLEYYNNTEPLSSGADYYLYYQQIFQECSAK